MKEKAAKGECVLKLSADLVYAALKEQYPVKMMGKGSREMTLARPELYLDNSAEFLSDHLYLAAADQLPPLPRPEPGAVLVVIGEGSRLAGFRDRCCLIVIRGKADFFEVNSFLCRLFDRYYEWEKQLFDIFLTTADLREIVRCSAPIFGRPIHVLDASFRYLTAAEDQAQASLDPELMRSYLASSEMDMNRHGAVQVERTGAQYLYVNLFSCADSYLGCVYLEGGGKPFEPGCEALAEYLAHLLEKAIERNPAVLGGEQTTLKTALMNLVCGYPLTANQKWKLNLAGGRDAYLCLSLHSARPSSRLPRGYICSVFESAFQDAAAFPKKNTIVCFLKTESLADRRGDYHAALNRRLKQLLSETSGIAGISNSFTDLGSAGIAFAQAEAAIDSGMITNPDSELYYFQSYALISMIINSTGSLPAEAYFSERLQDLIRHDKTGPISYLDTLRVFLRSGQSYSKTAEELYIHRSTVVDRISRIERELRADLKDPDTRLQLEIILKAMEIEGIVRQGKE